MKMIFWIFGLIALGGIVFYLLHRSKGGESNHITKKFNYGPFVIQADARTSKTFNIYNGMGKSTTVSYGIWYDDKPVTFPSSLQTNTGLPFLWRIYALPDAPEPTLIAGSQSLYLIYIKDGQPVVDPIAVQSSDFASLQFLDSDEGQPGMRHEVFSKGDTSDIDMLDTLKGGKYLLVNNHLVMDIQTGTRWLFNPNNEAIDNYSYPQPDHAIAFSPDHKKIVFNAAFQSWNTEESKLPDSEHTIIVYDFVTDKGYSVLYDDTDTRMKNISDIDREWLNTYFEWNANGDTLSLKKWDKLPYWTGDYNEKDNYYHLYPVKAGMLPVFTDFVLNQMGWSSANILKDTSGEYTGHTLEVGTTEIKLDIVFKEDEQQISFSKGLYEPDKEEYNTLIKKISTAFDAELSAGKHQEYFGRIVSETKRILAL